MTRVYYDEGGIRIASDSLVVPGLTCAMEHVLWADIEHYVESSTEPAADAITISITTYPDPAQKYQHHTIREFNRQRADCIVRAVNDAVDARYERAFRGPEDSEHVPLASIPQELPEAIRRAAWVQVNTYDSRAARRELVASFGESSVGSRAHRQLSFLCAMATAAAVPAWSGMCDDNIPEQIAQDLRRWLDDPTHPVDWARARLPRVAMRGGAQIVDCDACRLEPIASAVAWTADYLQTASPWSVEEVLSELDVALSEGCRVERSDEPFDRWLVFNLLARALERA